MTPTEARQHAIDAAAASPPFDVLVIGGGIVGAGVSRDAAMRGLRTLLVDQNDFAFGTSGRSSRLLHGGLRYLAQGRIGLVREASIEKVILHKIAPHLAEPLPFIFPTRRGTAWTKCKLRIGVKLYDLLCSGGNLGKSRTLGREAVLSALPQLNPEKLTGAVRYFDGFTNDARLVLDTLRSAQANGATLMNYAAAELPQREGEAWRVKLVDRVTGRSVEVRTKTVVNAAGAWADRFPPSEVKLRLTKGVHLVIDRARLNVPDAVVMADGSRILFAIPWGERVILGTTDTDYAGPTDAPTCEPEDVRYILNIANDTFPAARISPGDVVSTWAGLRPLIGGGSNARGKPSDISRAHQIRMPQPGWIDVAGGKLTTYRLMAEQTVDRILKFTSAASKPCMTAETPLLPDEPRPAFSGILPPAVSRAAVEHYCRNEWVVHLYDVMIRRTSWRYYHRDHARLAEEVAPWMAEALGWDGDRLRQELEAYLDLIGSPACLADGGDRASRAEQVQSA
ncbi:MAG TPA: glycerol-3-phosphate dehydrogenase/oxidase [Tepidisphaeraceae bacterium]|nr:glycerol-3-phosphate dehydrogenase/oxidase [Tepidisphaeraceae bacterium]